MQPAMPSWFVKESKVALRCGAKAVLPGMLSSQTCSKETVLSKRNIASARGTGALARPPSTPSTPLTGPLPCNHHHHHHYYYYYYDYYYYDYYYYYDCDYYCTCGSFRNKALCRPGGEKPPD